MGNKCEYWTGRFCGKTGENCSIKTEATSQIQVGGALNKEGTRPAGPYWSGEEWIEYVELTLKVAAAVNCQRLDEVANTLEEAADKKRASGQLVENVPVSFSRTPPTPKAA